MDREVTCPRCRANNMQYPGGSRATADREIEVCGSCCSDEAWLSSKGKSVQKVAAWPVARSYTESGAEMRSDGRHPK